MGTHVRKTPLEINCLHLDNKGIYSIFKTCYVIPVLFPTKCQLLHNFNFFFSNNTDFFICHVMQFKHQTSHLNVKIYEVSVKTLRLGSRCDLAIAESLQSYDFSTQQNISRWRKKYILNIHNKYLQTLTFRGPCIVIYSYNKTNNMH